MRKCGEGFRNPMPANPSPKSQRRCGGAGKQMIFHSGLQKEISRILFWEMPSGVPHGRYGSPNNLIGPHPRQRFGRRSEPASAFLRLKWFIGNPDLHAQSAVPALLSGGSRPPFHGPSKVPLHLAPTREVARPMTHRVPSAPTPAPASVKRLAG
jgi:hypothetical protein